MDQLTRIDEKLDKVVDRIGSIDATLAGQAVSLVEHIRRTNALEERVEQVAADLRPVRDHVQRLKGVAAFVALGLSILELFHLWG